MSDNGLGFVAPPVCPTFAPVEGGEAQPEGAALWERYYGLYDDYLRTLSDFARFQSGCKSCVGRLLLNPSLGAEGASRCRDGRCGMGSDVRGCSDGQLCELSHDRSSSNVNRLSSRVIDDVEFQSLGRCDGNADVGAFVQRSAQEMGQERGPCDRGDKGRSVCGEDKCGSDNRQSGTTDAPIRGCELRSFDVEDKNGISGNHLGGVEDNRFKKKTNWLPRGPNYERNKANRDAKKKRRSEFKNSFANSNQALVLRPNSTGFWNSCSDDVRQSLIDSKAKMHIAENERKAIEAKQKSEDLTSPYACMLKAVKMAECAIKQKEKDGNNKIFGWAETVANASAENLARSVPDSAPSFEELSSKLQASSQSSFELELHAKDVELEEQKSKNDLLQDQINELLVQQSIAKSQSSILEKARIKSEKNSRNKVKNTPQDKYAVWNSGHVQLTRADIERDMYYS